MECKKCKNDDLNYFFKLKKKYICRKCLNFYGSNVVNNFYKSKKPLIELNYELTPLQNKISNEILTNLKANNNVALYAVCGAGKTELVYKSIEYYLSKKGRVGFAVTRKEIVIELSKRINNQLKNIKINTIFGGNFKNTNADLTILTTHQLYRFYKYFSLLIIDEVDAFPFKNNQTLLNFAKKSTDGNFIIMSATMDQLMKNLVDKENYKLITLNKRHHNFDLPVPVYFKIIFPYYKLIKYIKYFDKENLQVLLFIPTISLSKIIYKYLKNKNYQVDYINSKRSNKEIIKNFIDKKYNILITTSILERGVTFSNVQVIIYKADHFIYTKSTLIQISGRVGRVTNFPNGKIIILAKEKTVAIKAAIKEIENANKNLPNL